MNLMKSLHEYEELLAPARQRFAVSPGIQAIQSNSGGRFCSARDNAWKRLSFSADDYSVLRRDTGPPRPNARSHRAERGSSGRGHQVR
jgi:hypothetical protein